MERREDEVQYFNVEKTNTQQDKIILTLFSILMNALIGSLFFYYSTHENKYGGDQCKYLRSCAFWFSIYCFFSLFAWIVLNPYAIYYKHDQIFDYANIVEGSIKLVFFILFYFIYNFKSLWVANSFNSYIHHLQCFCIPDFVWIDLFHKTQNRRMNLIVNYIQFMQQQSISDFDNLEQEHQLIDQVNQKSKSAKFKQYKQGQYYGDIQNNIRHGYGLMTYQDRYYIGFWKNDKKHGLGKEVLDKGDQYEGQFEDGKPHGEGTLETSNGIYSGQWVQGIKQGYGKWRGKNNEIYAGEWKFNKANGYGRYDYQDGGWYEGEFKNYLKYGKGKENYANGDFYDGDFINDKPDGFGVYRWADGSSYHGTFCSGVRHGKGYWLKNGDPQNHESYDGEYVNDLKSGHGVYRWPSGNVYEGEFFNDHRHGFGEMRWVDGSFYKGQFHNGQMCGEGELKRNNKPIIYGYFENNKLVKQQTKKSIPKTMNQSQNNSYDGKRNYYSLHQSFNQFQNAQHLQKYHFKSESIEPIIRQVKRDCNTSIDDMNKNEISTHQNRFKISIDLDDPQGMTTQQKYKSLNTTNRAFQNQQENLISVTNRTQATKKVIIDSVKFKRSQLSFRLQSLNQSTRQTQNSLPKQGVN
ncbi:unnamed protein product [Paramecium pentaurelia]|uniref:MORN motif protein n=1 Tax=Paramecium pentaurelia TaxID=43138 RepID=A0A8S1SK36_9CILI|nr:unnamed protein product [Paramecium pentaurelia]